MLCGVIECDIVITIQLLQAAQSAVEMAQFYPSRIMSAGAISISALTVMRRLRWRAAVDVFRHRSARRRLATYAAVGLMFLAIAPSLFPLDHLVFGHPENQADESIHAAHCHGSPGTCSDLPLQLGPGQFLLNEPLIVVPALFAVLLVMTMPMSLGMRHRPEVPPPQRRLAFA